jgi:dCTP diphosphatase
MSQQWTDLLKDIIKFRDARDWKQFHTPKNLAAAIAIETAELQEHFLWLTDEQSDSRARCGAKRREIIDELADVLIYSILLADRLDVDIPTAVRKKLRSNTRKYPIKKARGTARKYTELH